MKHRRFGNTGLEVSEIGLGAFPIAGLRKREDGTYYGWTGTNDEESIALLHRAEELGVNLIDSAEGYGGGHSEVLAGRAAEGPKRQVDHRHEGCAQSGNRGGAGG